MMEFIVLGQIPGTHIQITLSWLIFALFGLLLWADIKLHTVKRNNTKTSKKSRPTRRARA